MPPSSATAQNQKSNQQQETRRTDYADVDGSPGLGDWLANAVVLVATWPINFAAKVINPFVERGGAGIQALGAIAFLGGVLAGADNFYQLFTDRALLPWYISVDWVGDQAVENIPAQLSWLTGLWGGTAVVGWGAVFFSLFSVGFLIALAFSLLTQFIQGQAVRGRSLTAAQAEFQKWNAPTVPDKPDPNKKLDMAQVSWKELKRTGKNQRSFIGFIAIALWATEFVTAFAAHNPLQYVGQAGQFIGCTVYALVTIAAGEIGYTLYCAAKDEGNSI